MHELADRREHGGDGLIVRGELLLDACFECIVAPGQFLVGADPLAQLHECPHDVEAHLDGAGAVEDGGGHDGAVLGEGERRKTRVAVLLGTGRKMRPVQGIGLLGREPEHEILRKPPRVALDLLVQALGGDAVEGGEVRIEDDALTAQYEDGAGDVGDGRGPASPPSLMVLNLAQWT